MVSPRSEEERRIAVHAVGGRGFVYELEDVKLLRERYHIAGTLTGVLPAAPQQNVFMGLPLELMPEDVAWLVNEADAAYVVDDAAAHWAAAEAATDADREASEAAREERERIQTEQYKENAWRKREAAMAAQRAKGKPVKEVSRDDFYASIDALSKAGVSVEIPDVTDLPAYDAERARYASGDARASSTAVRAPSPAAYAMYRHLHSKGYFLSPALRFGGQFLAYPGDSLRYHSHYIAIGYDWDTPFSVMDVVGGGRLGTTVKKCWVVGASPDTADPSAYYAAYSIEWAGFG